MKKYICVLFACLLTMPLGADAGRKKVGVVLGGGGAKGFAHIGVLKVLEEAGVPVDYVVGTSMGAIVGGLYAVGYNAAEIDSLVRLQDWMNLLSDKVERSYKTFPEKENSERYVLSIPFGKDKKDRVISGVIRGQNIEKLFSDLTTGYHDSVDFTSFPIPYACVAVDVVSGKEYVFHSGNLPRAMRASMSIPAFFTPVSMDSMVLIDGGINNNFPVDIARQMGADLIIGVDLGTNDLKTREKINTPSDLVGQFIALYGHDKYIRNRDSTDLLLRPDMKPFNAASFGRQAIDTIISRGEQIAHKHWDEILALKEKAGIRTEDTPAVEQQTSHLLNPSDTFRITHITFDGVASKDERWLKQISGLTEGAPMTLKELQDAMSVVVGTNMYSYVSYELTGGNPYTLHLITEPKSMTSFNVGIRFDTEEIAAGLLNATLDHRGERFRQKLAFTGRAGKTSYGRLDYSIERTPLRAINLSYMFRYQDLDIYRQGEKTFNTTYTHHFAELAYSDMNWLNFMVKAGLRYEYYDHNSFLYTGETHDYSVQPEGYISYFLSTHLETLDKVYFPQKGVSLRADYSLYTDNFVGYNGSSPFSVVSLNFTAVLPLPWLNRRLDIIPSFYGRGLIGGNLAYPFLNAIGGPVYGKYIPHQIPFAGINHVELTDNLLGVARLDLRQQLWSRHYITLTGNYGVSHDDLTELFKGANLWGGSLSYAFDTFAGPISATLSLSNWHKSVQFYLNAGFYF